MTAVVTLCTDAMYAAKVLGQDQTPTSGDIQLVLRRLQRYLDLHSNEKQLIFANTTQTFTMSPNVATYSTSLFAQGRPIAINSMVVTLSNINYPVDLIDVLKWNDIGYKLTTAIPDQCYYDATYPQGTMNFFPVPYAAFVCQADCQYPLTGALTLSTNLTLPPGYEAWIVAALAINIWGSFKNGNPDPALVEEAREARAILKRNNFQPLEMVTPFSQDWGDISNAFLYKGF